MRIVYKNQEKVMTVSNSFGFITGCDSKQEWMLEWWLNTFRKWNNYPVAFADFGMSYKAREWCKSKGKLIDVTDINYRDWFRKPFAMIRSPFYYSVWLDLDCEVRRNLLPLLDYAKKGFGATHDVAKCKVTIQSVQKHKLTQTGVNSGLVTFTKGNKILEEWVRLTPVLMATERGDQEVLHTLQETRKDEITIIPKLFMWIRLDPPPSKDVYMLHWTGSKGKKVIKTKIENNI